MESIDISLWDNFWETFRLSILMSLLGALIGHYSKNGVIQLPLFVIPYEKGEIAKKAAAYWRILKWPFIMIDYVRFLIGLRSNEEQAGKRTYFELGFLGDILIGIGTGILAKTAIELSETQNVFAEISASFISGFAGLSYIRERQKKDLGIHDDEGTDGSGTPLDPSKVAQPAEYLETEKPSV